MNHPGPPRVCYPYSRASGQTPQLVRSSRWPSHLFPLSSYSAESLPPAAWRLGVLKTMAAHPSCVAHPFPQCEPFAGRSSQLAHACAYFWQEREHRVREQLALQIRRDTGARRWRGRSIVIGVRRTLKPCDTGSSNLTARRLWRMLMMVSAPFDGGRPFPRFGG